MKSGTLRKTVILFVWALIIFFSVYYIYANCLRYFVFTPKSYHFDFFWSRKYWVFTHVLSGMIATIVSPFQYWPVIRKRYFALHKLFGKTYVYAIIVSSVTSFYLCATTPENIWYAAGLGGFTAAWLVTALAGMYNALSGKVEAHKEWMLRSFVVTIGFSLSRLLEDIVVNASLEVNRVERLTVLAWVSWILPLAITELFIIQRRKNKQKSLSVRFFVAEKDRTSMSVTTLQNSNYAKKAGISAAMKSEI